MKKSFLITIPLFTVIVIGATMLLLNRRIPAWHEELDQYLAYLTQNSGAAYTLTTSARANQPGNFSPALGVTSFSDSVIFQTTLNSNPESSNGGQPLPYPPQEVECILLRAGEQYKLVYAALYSNLYNADWVIHISPNAWQSPQLDADLATLGCNLDR